MASFIITLRETLEVALIVGILLAYLSKTLNFKHKKFVWYGVGCGVILSLILAFIFQQYLGGFEGKSEELYEGITMLIAAGLLTWMILWMLNQRHNIKKNLENKAQTHIEKDHPMGLFLLAFVGVAREGIETVIFLQAAVIQSEKSNILAGGFLGILAALFLGFVLFKGIMKVNLRTFFTITGLLLILFAAGLVAHGVHEFEEAGVIPIIREHVWDINPTVVTEGVYPLWHEKGIMGGLLKGLFGYNGDPSLTEVLSYLLYLLVIGGAWNFIGRREVNKARA